MPAPRCCLKQAIVAHSRMSYSSCSGWLMLRPMPCAAPMRPPIKKPGLQLLIQTLVPDSLQTLNKSRGPLQDRFNIRSTLVQTPSPSRRKRRDRHTHLTSSDLSLNLSTHHLPLRYPRVLDWSTLVPARLLRTLWFISSDLSVMLRCKGQEYHFLTSSVTPVTVSPHPLQMERQQPAYKLLAGEISLRPCLTAIVCERLAHGLYVIRDRLHFWINQLRKQCLFVWNHGPTSTVLKLS